VQAFLERPGDSTPLRWIDRQQRIWRLAGPVILSNATTPLLGAVDTGVVGRLSDPALIGGVALGAIIFAFIFWGFGFLRMGTTGFTAQAWGAGDPAELRGAFLRALAVALAIGLALVMLQLPIRLLALALVQGSPAVKLYAGLYFDVRIWSAPAALVNYAVLGWLLGTRRTATALVLQILINGLNIALSILLGLKLGWGIRGVAGATLIAEWLSAAIGLALVLTRLPHTPTLHLLARARVIRLLTVNLNIMLRTFCIEAAFVVFTFAGARLGDIPLAANAILMNLLTILAYGLDGFAMAAEILVGGAVGAQDRSAFRAAVTDSTLWAAAVAMFGTVFFLAAGGPVIDLFTVHEPVRAVARHYLPWLALAPIVAVWCYQLDGIYIGATRTVEMRNGMLLALAGNLLVLWQALPWMGNHALWLALMVFFILRALPLALWLPRIDRSLTEVASLQ
jgi:multidrug resistance protein, MATE family